VTEAACWAHGRRNFFELADPTLRKKDLLSPIALEAVKRIDAVFTIEREINGQPAEARLAARQHAFTVFLRDGRIWFTNNAAERPLRGIALGRKACCLPVVVASAPASSTA
jgi:hypothetical protein